MVQDLPVTSREFDFQARHGPGCWAETGSLGQSASLALIGPLVELDLPPQNRPAKER
jgi:hypothetical protein